jgi:putative tryptophan/tyrosine transport system substrate-binding protein
VIGVLSSMSYSSLHDSERAFVEGLKASGFLEDRNISIEWRWAEGQYNRLASLAGELVRRDVAVIIAWDAPSALAAKAATRTIPIVFATGTDPLKLGLVDSFNQPRGNLTGVTTFLSSLGPKQLELLRELLPRSDKVAFLVNPSNLNARIDAPEIQTAADALGQHLEVLTASTENELDAAFTTMVQERIDALLVKPDPFFIDRRKRLVALASRHAVPAIYPIPVFVEVGGLMSYGTDLAHAYQQAGIYVGKLLRACK